MERKSSKTTWVIIVVIVAALLSVVAYAVATNRPKPDDNSQTASTNSNPQKTEESNSDDTKADQSRETMTITFTDEGFSPATYSAKVGQAVRVDNKSSMQVQFSSDDHPTHTGEPELNLDVLAPGESASFTPTKAGTWGFHDHLHDQYTGTLEVTE